LEARTAPDGFDLPAFAGEPLRLALDGIGIPMYVVDRRGVLLWANSAAARLFGTRAGEADSRDPLGPQLARNMAGATTTVQDVTVSTADGAWIYLRVHSAPIRAAGRTVAAFAVAVPLPSPIVASTPTLTARQTEVLHLLAQGLGTKAVAVRLGIATETARNHIRAVLHRLDAHSRLEAVVEARRRGLLGE